MLARRLITILLAMTLAEAIETTRIHRVASFTGDRTAWVTTRPFRAPHQTISDAGVIGGEQVPMPDEVSLAYHRIRMSWTGTRPHPAPGRHMRMGQTPQRSLLKQIVVSMPTRPVVPRATPKA